MLPSALMQVGLLTFIGMLVCKHRESIRRIDPEITSPVGIACALAS